MINFGKWKYLSQQASATLSFPIALLTNFTVIVGFFGWDYAFLVLGGIGAVMAGLVVFIDRVTMTQELDYAWAKASEWQKFRADFYALKERIERGG